MKEKLDDNTNIIVFQNKNIEKTENNEQIKNHNKRNIYKNNFMNNDVGSDSKTDRMIVKMESKKLKQSSLAEKNENEINIIKNVLFTQLGKINVKLEGKLSKESKEIPRIETIELTLLNQSVSIFQLKEYGFNIFVFFLYLVNVLVTFFILLVFAISYICYIFFKYYKDFEEEYSLIEDYNILSIVSGVQIIKFRKLYIDIYGKEAFLEKYKNFDVFYKEYIYTGIFPLISAYLANLIFMLCIMRSYKSYKYKNPEIKDFSLILYGNDLPYLEKKVIEDMSNEEISQKKREIKKNILEEELVKLMILILH